MSANYGEILAPSTLESVQDLKFSLGVRNKGLIKKYLNFFIIFYKLIILSALLIILVQVNNFQNVPFIYYSFIKDL